MLSKFQGGVTDGQTDGQTNRPIDGRTDLLIEMRSCRTHLKMIGSGAGGILLVIDGVSKKGNRPMDRQTLL